MRVFVGCGGGEGASRREGNTRKGPVNGWDVGEATSVIEKCYGGEEDWNGV